ncbi:MAG: radical SAM protein [Phycisphaerae bacterium]|jgi:MoaA/NifB/PqqE/SkfB family radical SAM enzyme|nr:radical SAM protein [Phycisphaerae bacterium]
MSGFIRKIIRKHLSQESRSFLRTAYGILRHPSRTGKLLNRYKYDSTVAKSSVIDYTPPVFAVTITDTCNLRCPTCLYLLEDEDKFTPSFIKVDEFKTILEAFNKRKFAEVIFLTGGEPLLHPDLSELIDTCREYDLAVKTSTNGILLPKVEEVLPKFDYVNVSLDAFDEASFKEYRGGTPAQFARIKEGVGILNDKGVNFSVSFLLSNDNISQLDKMLAFAEVIQPKFVYLHNINPHGCEGFESLSFQDERVVKELKGLLSTREHSFDIHVAHVFDKDSTAFTNGVCVQPWYYFCFNSCGDVAYCCHLAHDNSIGNVLEEYDNNSPPMRSFRDAMMKAKYPVSCRYCQRRFLNDDFAHFHKATKQWTLLQDKPFKTAMERFTLSLQ